MRGYSLGQAVRWRKLLRASALFSQDGYIPIRHPPCFALVEGHNSITAGKTTPQKAIMKNNQVIEKLTDAELSELIETLTEDIELREKQTGDDWDGVLEFYRATLKKAQAEKNRRSQSQD